MSEEWLLKDEWLYSLPWIGKRWTPPLEYTVFAAGRRVGTISRNEYTEIKDCALHRGDVWLETAAYHIGAALRLLWLFAARTLHFTVGLPLVAIIWASFRDPTLLAITGPLPPQSIAAAIRMLVTIAMPLAIVSVILAPPENRRSPRHMAFEGALRRRLGIEEYKRVAIIPDWIP